MVDIGRRNFTNAGSRYEIENYCTGRIPAACSLRPAPGGKYGTH